MRRRFKIAFVILMVVTVIWILACYLHVQTYNKYIRERRERYLSMGFPEEYVREYIHFKPVWMWGHAGLLLLIGLFMFFVWIGFCAELRRKMRKC